MPLTHTPGPWHYGPDQQGTARVFAGTHEIVRALSTHGNRRIPAAERAANATLIAAAPDMLAVLRKVAAYFEPIMEDNDAIKIELEVDAVIARAEGREQPRRR